MIRHPIRTAGVALAAALVLAGCKPNSTETPAPPPSKAAKPASTATPESLAASTSPLGALADVDKTPSLVLPTVDGKTFDISQHRGSWVVVNYWATWCHPCLEEMPDLSALAAMREYIHVIGVANEDISEAEMLAFLKKRPVVYPIALVDPMKPPADFGVAPALPITWLVGPEGRIVKRFMGPVTAKEIEAAVAEAGGPKGGA